MTVNTNHVATHQHEMYQTIWERWITLWNGAFELAETTVDGQVVCHLPDGSRLPSGRDRLVERISALHAAHPDVSVATEVGPLVSAGVVAGQWIVNCPGIGDLTGADVLRMGAGRVVEHWTSHDLVGTLVPATAQPTPE